MQTEKSFSIIFKTKIHYYFYTGDNIYLVKR